MRWIRTEPLPNNRHQMCRKLWVIGGEQVWTWQEAARGVWRWTCTCGVAGCIHGAAITDHQQRDIERINR